MMKIIKIKEFLVHINIGKKMAGIITSTELTTILSEAADYKQYLNFFNSLLQNVDRMYVSEKLHRKNQTPTYHP